MITRSSAALLIALIIFPITAGKPLSRITAADTGVPDSVFSAPYHSGYKETVYGGFRPAEVITDQEKIIYEYDSGGRCILINYSKDKVYARESFMYYGTGKLHVHLWEAASGASMQNFSRETYTYDDAGNTAGRLNEVWKENRWEGKERYTYIYNENERITVTELWQGAEWVIDSRLTYRYDNEGKLTGLLAEKRLSGILKNNYRYDYVYEGGGNLIKLEKYEWQNEAWEPIHTIHYSYSGTGLLLTRLYETKRSWEKGSLDTYTYDGEGRMRSWTYQIKENEAWVNVVRETYVYESYLTERLREDWADTVWQNNSRTKFTYDGGGRELERLQEIWRTDGWEVNYKNVFAYDSYGNTVHASAYQGKELNPVVSYLPVQYNEGADQIYFYARRADITYSNVLSAETESKINDFELTGNYPNPFNPATSIYYRVARETHVLLEIYNVMGELTAVLKNEVQPAGSYTVSFDGSGSASGVYICRLKAGEFMTARKMILMK